MAMSDRAKKSNLCYLVFHGGTKVCRALFEKLMKELKPAGEDSETWTVDKFLQIKKVIIQSKLSSEKKLILYPGAQQKTDIQQWDISILCLILLETCVLPPVIRMYVVQIRKQRNKIAHLRDSDIDDNAYQCIYEKLKVCFDKILSEVNDDGLKRTIENMLKQLDTGSIPNDELIRVEEAIRQSSKDITEEVIYQGVETRKVLQKDNEQVSRRLDQLTSVVEEFLKLMKDKTPAEIPTPGINIKVPMQNCTLQAEKAIVKVLNHEVEDDCDLPEKDMDNLKSTIYELQEEFTEKGRPITSADVGCIILHIQCSSTLSLLNLIRDYLNGSLDESLKKLEKATRSLDGCKDLRLETVLYEDEVLRILSDLDFGELLRLAKSVPVASDLPVQSESLENASDEKVSTEDFGELFRLAKSVPVASDLPVQSKSLENVSDEKVSTEEIGPFEKLAEGVPAAADNFSDLPVQSHSLVNASEKRFPTAGWERATMTTVEHEYYIRFILLLLQVGTDLLREITKKALKNRGETLHQFLNSSQHAILNDRKLTRIQKDTLYPSNPRGASIKDFDITLLSHLIYDYLSKDIVQFEMDATNDIRQLRNKYQSPTTEAKMDPKTYTKDWTKLIRIIIAVDNGMSSEVGLRHAGMIDIIENDSIDIMALLKEIKKSDMSRVFFESIQQCLERVQTDLQDFKTTMQHTADTVAGKDTNAKAKIIDTKAVVMETNAEVIQMKDLLVQIKQQRENLGRITKIVHTMYGNVYLSADDQEAIHLVEADLVEASTNRIAKKERQTLQEKGDILLKDIENLDVEPDGTDKQSKENVIDKLHAKAEIMDTKTEVMQMKALLVQIKQQRESQGKITKIVQTIYGKVYLSANNQDAIHMVEADLVEGSNNRIAKKETTGVSHQALQEKVAIVVNDIENLDVNVVKIDRG